MTDAFNLEDIAFETNEPRDIFADKAGFDASQEEAKRAALREKMEEYPPAPLEVPVLDVQLSPQDTRAVAFQVLLQNASIRGVGYNNAAHLIAEAQAVTAYLETGWVPVAGADGAGTDAQPDLG